MPDPTPLEGPSELERLRRRLDRERQARHEAERIAESSLRELYLRQEDLGLLERAARAANEGDDARVVIGSILRDMGSYAGWPVGHAFLRDGDDMVATGLWHLKHPERHGPLVEATEGLRFASGVGMPGRVLASGETVWADDVATDDSLPRRAAFAASGLAGGFAFPVLAGPQIIAVLEFYSSAVEPPDQRVLDVAAQVAVQAGRALERQQADRELRRAHAELEVTLEEFARSNQELESFAYIASHDLQEPLRSISGFLQLLERRYQGELDARADEYIAFAVDGAARMQGLIDDLLAFSRVGRQELHLGPVDVRAVLDQALLTLAAAIEETDGRVLAEELPTVHADPGQLAQVLVNLVGNAVKFRGDAPPVVAVRAERDDDAALWRIVVEDNGIGIPPEQAEHVFEMFKRLHTRSDYPGTGLGLAISQKIVERLGGTLGVQGRDGGGSRFAFTIPDPRVD